MFTKEYKGYDIISSDKRGMVECQVSDGSYILAEYKMACQSRKQAFDMLKQVQRMAADFIDTIE